MAEKKVLDIRGIIFPLDLLQFKNCLNAMKKGERLEVILNDEEVARNLKLLVQRSDDALLYHKKHMDYICLGILKKEGSG